MKINLNVRRKIILIAFLAAFLPALVVVTVTEIQKSKTSESLSVELDKQVRQYLGQVVLDAANLCETVDPLVQEHVNASLEVARDLMNRTGRVTLSSRTTPWNAINQYTKEQIKIDLLSPEPIQLLI